jgi:pyruvate/2-oxoglutarate dehydrogenase complex dihydrolipoamide dehydrogenase (E3) component
VSATWASDDVTPPDARAWDLLVVGGGTAGIVAARTAAGFGASVLLVERDRIGGDCLWTGCVPSKALLAAAHTAADARASGRFGVHTGAVQVDFAAVMAHVRSRIAAIEPDDAPDTLRGSGTRVVRAQARFTDADEVELVSDGAAHRVRFRQAVVATGSQPLVPSVPGLAAAQPLTSDSVWDLTELPARLLVLGGGSIGCELGQALARLGSAVTLVEAADHLLPREDPDAARRLQQALEADGVDVRLGTPLTRVEPAGSGGTAYLRNGDAVAFDRVLVAVGRRPRTEGLGLDAAGIELDERGFVRVDPGLHTTGARVWAAGDVTGHPAFTHVAGVHGSLAAANAVLGLRRTVDLRAVPRVTYTRPEVASVGVGRHEIAQHPGTRVVTTEHAHVDRAVAELDTDGVTHLVLDRRGRVVGGTVVGPRAGESLAELVLAVQHRLRARDLASAVHAYPTYGDGPWKSGISAVQESLRRQPTRTAIRALVALRRRRPPR